MNKIVRVFLVVITSLSVTTTWGSEALTELRKERRALQKQLRTAVPNLEERDPDLADLQRKSIEAMKAYEKAIDAHPRLQHVKKEMTEATGKLTKAISQKDKKAQEEAQAEISAIMSKRMQEASQEEDLKPLAQASQNAGEAYNNRKRELLASLPETKVAAARLDEINGLIQKELAKQRKNP